MLGVARASRSAIVRFPGPGADDDGGSRRAFCPRAGAGAESAGTFSGSGARTAGATGGNCGACGAGSAGCAPGARDAHDSCTRRTGPRSRRRPTSK